MTVGLANSLDKVDYTYICILEVITILYPRVDDASYCSYATVIAVIYHSTVELYPK